VKQLLGHDVVDPVGGCVRGQHDLAGLAVGVSLDREQTLGHPHRVGVVQERLGVTRDAPRDAAADGHRRAAVLGHQGRSEAPVVAEGRGGRVTDAGLAAVAVTQHPAVGGVGHFGVPFGGASEGLPDPFAARSLARRRINAACASESESPSSPGITTPGRGRIR
jgi:hypothetical protein